MTKKQSLDFIVKKNLPLSAGNFLLILKSQRDKLPDIMPGQFVEVLIPGNQVFLRRPISVFNVEKEDNELWLLIDNIGKGTGILSEIREQSMINLLLPLGNSFGLEKSGAKPLLVGGGVGIAPMLYLARKLKEKSICPTILLGGRNKENVIMVEEFEKYGHVEVTTDDGSLGVQGRVTEHPLWNDMKADAIYVCGPKPMMKAVAKLAREKNIYCEVSLENRMACGVGACLCCVEDTIDKGNICVCTEGPIFSIDRLRW
ncbi:dihydroorotate dehydrogenase electron transfer subunit [Porphyromonas pogonae]|uniref:dihydroorotate dehydrogenase electron transfer subunit n=1 Tax=Porphyromonas pogonae TaxID=867595 RepID=UPI002E781198|nr:dihydroorotate dehydrogenase electron transfer subunit [Porphyromonas pogonae]